MTRCPFCTQDPYHYVDNGVGMEAVAVTCCEPGIGFFQGGLEPPAMQEMGIKILNLYAAMDVMEEEIIRLQNEAEKMFEAALA
jgi:hypothetical protein